MNKQEKMAT